MSYKPINKFSISKLKYDCNLTNFSDILLEFAVVVAESQSNNAFFDHLWINFTVLP